MRAKICIGLMAGLFFTTSFVKADVFYVRNHPFKQVIQSGSQAYVSLEAFLSAVGLNWDSDGKVVTVTTSPASNPPLGNGLLTIKFGDSSVDLDASNRGESTYVSLRPVAHLLGYNVIVNHETGIVDIIQAHQATAQDKALLAKSEADKTAQEKAISEAWEKKAAEIKAKREAAADDTTASNSTDKTEDKTTTTKKPAKSTTAATTVSNSTGRTDATNSSVASADTTGNSTKEKPVVKQPRLEVLRSDADPDYSNGAVKITVQVKNDGEGAAKSVSGRLIVTGPSGESGTSVSPSAPVLAGASSNTQVQNDNVGQKEWLSQYVSGPSLAPDGTWNYETIYRHPQGASMPHGPIKVELKLDTVKN